MAALTLPSLAAPPQPTTAPPLRWGILGAGGIAGRFAQEIPALSSGQVVAVGSRSRSRAADFAARHGIAGAHGSYPELVAAVDVDAVYVASPHSEHREHALLAIEAGKHVLVEKAFTRNAAEARDVFAAAQQRGVFVMEAMWTRFLPHMVAVRELLAREIVGEVVSLFADHGQRLDTNPSGRLLNAALAGGALLDLGVYPLSFAHDVLGLPDSVLAAGAMTETGVDGQEAVVLRYGRSKQAVCTATLWAATPTTAAICGTEGRIDIAGPFFGPARVTVTRGQQQATIEPDPEAGFQYEAAEVARCVADGVRQSPTMPWQHTLDVLTTMDTVRGQLGVHYPGE